MGSDTEPDPYTIPKLPLFSMTPHSIPEPSGISTPPLQPTASVPFRWEEQPGKPRPCTDIIISSSHHTTLPNKRLELPPRLAIAVADSTITTKTSSLSPTTVLDGPSDVEGKLSLFLSSSSFRFPNRRLRRERRQRSFDSSCSGGWSLNDDDDGGGGQRQLLLVGGKIERRNGGGGLFGSFRLRGNNNNNNKGVGGFVISPLMTSSMEAGFVEERKKMRRNSSMSKVSGSHFWAKIYEGFKQVVPWRKKPKMEKSFIL